MPSALKLLGQRFGRLLVIDQCEERRRNNIVWLCKCECGSEVKIPGKDLRYGNTTSCGCLQKEVAALNVSTATRTHGMSHKTYLYGIWTGIKDRCYNTNHPAYPNYGGRGITMCVEWIEDFAQFVKDVGDRPSDEHTLDRLDNNSGYCKDNCRWITRKLQSRNRRKFKNNSSGITGVYESINGYWIAKVSTLDGKDKSECFSIKRFGYDTAKALAIESRKRMILELNKQGAGYTENHGE